MDSAKLRAADEENSKSRNGYIFELHCNLFDKLLFNKTLDQLEKAKLHYKILQWSVGHTVSETSQVSMEVEKVSEDARTAIKTLCSELGGDYFEGES